MKHVSYLFTIIVAASLMACTAKSHKTGSETETSDQEVTQADSLLLALEKEYGWNKKAGEEFLVENKTKKGVITTESGLQYKIIKEGTGATAPTDTTRVIVNYVGTLIDGAVFTDSYKNNKGEPAKHYLHRVIDGWTEALSMMPVGSRWVLYIPQELAYDKRERAEGMIKPFSTLIFDVELLGFEE